MKVTKKRRKSSVADLTPMIDVIFQLILFFMVSTTFINNKALKVNLPSSETSQSVEVTGITLTVDKDGSMQFNAQDTTLEDLPARLNSFDTQGKNKEEIPVNLEADEEVKNGTIVNIFDQLRKCGFVSVSLRTKS